MESHELPHAVLLQLAESCCDVSGYPSLETSIHYAALADGSVLDTLR